MMKASQETRRSSLWWAIAIVSASLVVMVSVLPLEARAGDVSWPTDQPLVMSGNGISLVIVAGSEADSLVVNATTFVVTVGAGDSFVVKYPGPNPGRLGNDKGFSECLYSSGDNIVTFPGPTTVTVTPRTQFCTAPSTPSGGGGAGSWATVSLSSPNGGEGLMVGASQTVVWSAGGSGLDGLRLSLSTDGGFTFPIMISDNEYNDGSYSWTVPDVATASARLKIEVLDLYGTLLAMDTSDADFTIGIPPSEDTGTTGVYEPGQVLAAVSNINSDKNLEPVEGDPPCVSGSLIKGQSSPAVYYCGADGRRHVFPNERIYFSWYDDFTGVVSIADGELAAIPLGDNVTYRPGVRMIKIQTDPRVYAVARGGLLRWVGTEAIAESLYGPDWNQMIDDVSDAFFVNYTIGPPITEDDLP